VSNGSCAQAIDQAQGVCAASRLFLCARIDVSFVGRCETTCMANRSTMDVSEAFAR
jgi:hypothetical protein